VTPWRYKIKALGITGPAHNPAVRLVKYDRDTGKNLNVLQYYMDLPQSNAQKTPIWKLEYNATRDYQIDDVTPTSIHKLIQRMKPENSIEFKNFMKWHVVSVAKERQEECDDSCKTNMLCNFENVEQTSFDTCVKSVVGSAESVKVNTGLLALILIFITFIRH